MTRSTGRKHHTRPAPEIEAALFAAYYATRSVAARNAIVEAFVPFAIDAARRFHATLPPCVILEDVESSAMLGLMRAVEMFDPAHNVRFTTYARLKIRSFILEDLREADWVPRLVRQEQTKLKRAYAALAHELGRAPSPVELAEQLGVTSDRLLLTERLLAAADPASLSATNEDGDPIDRPAQERERDPADSVVNRLQADELLTTLSERDRTIVLMKYYEGRTQADIAAHFGRSEPWGSQRATIIYRSLRKQFPELVAA